MATPNPSILAGRATHASVVTAVIAATDPSAPAAEPKNVIRAKSARRGMVVRAWLHDAPRGGEYTIEHVKPSPDGASVHIEFVKPCQRPDGEYKAAYRFYVVREVELPKGESTEPTARKPRRRQPEHLTYQPFAGLKEIL